jgi:hypothetical protein
LVLRAREAFSSALRVTCVVEAVIAVAVAFGALLWIKPSASSGASVALPSLEKKDTDIMCA